MTEAKKSPDWERIEAGYRAGVMSLRELATLHGITEGAIRKRAKRDEWERAGKEPHPHKPVLAAIDPDDLAAGAGFVYVIYIDSGLERFYKIGMAKSFGARYDQHQTSSPFEICVACCYFCSQMRREERALHKRFSASRVRGEWYRLTETDLKEIAARALLV